MKSSRCKKLLCILLFAFVAATCASAQSLADSPVIFSNGQWDVHRTKDVMTDATICTGVYRGQYNIQLGENSLKIVLADAVKNVTLRFDEESPKASRPATRSEWKNKTIEISGSDFAELLDSRRLRYQALTESNTTVSGDIDLNGVFQVHDNVAAGCAGNPIAVPPPRPIAADVCTQSMRDRMNQKGLSAQDISDICSKSP